MMNLELTLTDRMYVCKTCGMLKNRDFNAAINSDKVGTAQPEPIDACGHDGAEQEFSVYTNPMMDVKKRMSEIIAQEAAAIAAIRVTDEFEHAVFALRDCQGKVLTTGIGKAGHVARKFAATLCSTATPAAFIHPGEAAHGDLGIIEDELAVA